jgi:hypothetical protein
MKLKLLVVFVALCLIATMSMLGVLLKDSGSDSDTDKSEAGLELRKAIEQRMQQRIETGRGAAGQPLAPAKDYLPPAVYCADDRACLQSPATAHSAVDYSWLRRHGYPTREQTASFRTMAEPELKQRADAGDVTAMSALGARLIDSDRGDEGLRRLIAAANGGSLFAYYGIADYVAARPDLGGHREAAAYLRLAYLLGDHHAAAALYRRFPELDRAQYAQIDRRATALYASFAKSRAPSPRPQPEQ